MTGINRIILPDFFSGFGAAIDLTLDLDYAGIVAFNETEVHQYFGGQTKVVATTCRKAEKAVLEKMKMRYDGF